MAPGLKKSGLIGTVQMLFEAKLNEHPDSKGCGKKSKYEVQKLATPKKLGNGEKILL